MLTLSLTHHPHARKELFLNKSLRIVSRSGLNATEAALIEQLPSLKKNTVFASPLFLGGRTGALAMTFWLTRGDSIHGTATVHTFDAHTLSTLKRNLEANHAPDSLLHAEACINLVPLVKPCDTVFWQITKGSTTAELELDTLEQLFAEPEAGPRTFYIAAEELNDTFVKRLKKHCGSVSIKNIGNIRLLQATLAKPIPDDERCDRRAEFEVSLPGHDPIKLMTYPGCFCHRRADMGGLALTETVASHIDLEKHDRIMDMGCGCGMDGILLATAFPEKELQIDYQDSNAAAWASAVENLRRYPHTATVHFSADGEGNAGTYDIFLANPPYFGDWRIAEFFVQTAARLLKKGGLIAFVSKREGKPRELLEQAGFTLLDAFPRRGYTVLLAEHP